MPLSHPRLLWLLATALAMASMATTTALASEPDEDDEDDGDAPALIVPTAPVTATPAPAGPAPAPAPFSPAPAVRKTQPTSLPPTNRRSARSRHARLRRVGAIVRPTVRGSRTSGVSLRTVPRGGIQAGAGGTATGSGADPLGLVGIALVLLAAAGLAARRPRDAR